MKVTLSCAFASCILMVLTYSVLQVMKQSISVSQSPEFLPFEYDLPETCFCGFKWNCEIADPLIKGNTKSVAKITSLASMLK
jgi:hypothetical protein